MSVKDFEQLKTLAKELSQDSFAELMRKFDALLDEPRGWFGQKPPYRQRLKFWGLEESPVIAVPATSSAPLQFPRPLSPEVVDKLRQEVAHYRILPAPIRLLVRWTTPINAKIKFLAHQSCLDALYHVAMAKDWSPVGEKRQTAFTQKIAYANDLLEQHSKKLPASWKAVLVPTQSFMEKLVNRLSYIRAYFQTSATTAKTLDNSQLRLLKTKTTSVPSLRSTMPADDNQIRYRDEKKSISIERERETTLQSERIYICALLDMDPKTATVESIHGKMKLIYDVAGKNRLPLSAEELVGCTSEQKESMETFQKTLEFFCSSQRKGIEIHLRRCQEMRAEIKMPETFSLEIKTQGEKDRLQRNRYQLEFNKRYETITQGQRYLHYVYLCGLTTSASVKKVPIKGHAVDEKQIENLVQECKKVSDVYYAKPLPEAKLTGEFKAERTKLGQQVTEMTRSLGMLRNKPLETLASAHLKEEDIQKAYERGQHHREKIKHYIKQCETIKSTPSFAVSEKKEASSPKASASERKAEFKRGEIKYESNPERALVPLYFMPMSEYGLAKLGGIAHHCGMLGIPWEKLHHCNEQEICSMAEEVSKKFAVYCHPDREKETVTAEDKGKFQARLNQIVLEIKDKFNFIREVERHPDPFIGLPINFNHPMIHQKSAKGMSCYLDENGKPKGLGHLLALYTNIIPELKELKKGIAEAQSITKKALSTTAKAEITLAEIKATHAKLSADIAAMNQRMIDSDSMERMNAFANSRAGSNSSLLAAFASFASSPSFNSVPLVATLLRGAGPDEIRSADAQGVIAEEKVVAPSDFPKGTSPDGLVAKSPAPDSAKVIPAPRLSLTP